ncbi:MAG: 2-oxo acid dehydrogenase subunit E2 [Nocardioidaceae bacterium]|nr:2-oxo acid dehydrogenase subunit E2 [Nocardioidaceae bacterium]
MARVLRMPGVAANTTEAVLAEWLVQESADFAAADPIATVETDKAAVDVEADAAGRVLKTLVPPGAQVEVGDPIAVLGDPGEQVDDLDALLASLGVGAVTDPVVPVRREVPAEPPPPTRVFASPLARRLAKDAGLALEEIDGTGPRGRVLRRDVDAAVAKHNGATAQAADDPTYELVPHSRVRRATARRLVESKRTAPHFYVRATVRAEGLLALRAALNRDESLGVSVNDLVVKAVAAAHERVPDLNVTWSDDGVRRYRSVDVGVAVATDRGLMTPVVRDVGSLTVGRLAREIRDLAERARDGRLRPDDLEGGSMAVTNLGMYGVAEFAAIINPPHAAILAVGAVRDEPVVEDGAVVPGKVMTVTLSVDHRPVDGVVAARWLAVLVELLEEPVRTLA